MISRRVCGLVAALMLMASNAGAMAEHIERIDPGDTTCAPLLHGLQQRSVGNLALALDMLPVTERSNMDYHRGDTNLYTDLAGVIVLPIDAEGYTSVVKQHQPSWLMLSFDANGSHTGVLHRIIAIATRKGCRVGEAYIAIADIPRDLKQMLLKAFTDVRNGGRGDPMALPDDEDTRIDRLFPASLDYQLQDMARGKF
jgi:hypothetical protein